MTDDADQRGVVAVPRVLKRIDDRVLAALEPPKRQVVLWIVTVAVSIVAIVAVRSSRGGVYFLFFTAVSTYFLGRS